jgi:hypothetical protein
LRHRKPSSPSVPTGISLDINGLHYGWVRDHCKTPIERCIENGQLVVCQVTQLGRRYTRIDRRLGAVREWRFATAICYIEDLTLHPSDLKED